MLHVAQVLVDVYGAGEDLPAIQAYAVKAKVNLVFKGPQDHAHPDLHPYKVSQQHLWHVVAHVHLLGWLWAVYVGCLGTQMYKGMCVALFDKPVLMQDGLFGLPVSIDVLGHAWRRKTILLPMQTKLQGCQHYAWLLYAYCF